jgi:hypothetical protein
MRVLSEKFMSDLIESDSVLEPVLARLKVDRTLMLAIRGDCINIYYRGGNILRLAEQARGGYQAIFDENYNRSGRTMPVSPAVVTCRADAQNWVDSFGERKNIMDEWFSTHEKAEREFQQLIARENNNSTISNESEYFISDIEYAEPGARFDMMAIRWLSNQRKKGNNCKVALVEVKYGDGALDGSAGILKHLQDMEKLILDHERYAGVLRDMVAQFEQLDRLGLVKYNKGISNARVQLDPGEKPEVIFILANHNPRSTKLKTILADPLVANYADSALFDLKFFVASFAGYGLHEKCMLPLEEFRKLL